MSDIGSEPRRDDPALQRFNESFYASDPADYLMTRFQLLLLAGGKRSQLQQLFEDGVEYAGMTLAPGTTPDGESSINDGADGEPGDQGDDDDPNLDKFLVVESQLLLHHACETALRMFFVHASASRVPWIDLAAERSFSRFKNHVRSEFIDKAPDDEVIAQVCLGSKRPPDGITADEWAESLEGIVAFLREFARCFLDDSNLYNGIKHGLGVSPGEAILFVGEQHLGFGPSVEYPESGEWNGKTREWSLTTQWIDISQSLALIYVAIQLIDSIWKIGRYRRIGGEPGGSLFFPATLRPSALRGSNRPPTRRMSWRLLVEERDSA